MSEQQTKIRTAKTILQKGVKVPLLTAPLLYRIFGRKTRNVRFRQPSFYGIVEIGELITEMGITQDFFDNLTTAQCYEFIRLHGDKCMRVIAICILRWPPFMWFRRRYARWLSKRIDPSMAAYALKLIWTLNDVGSFMNSIRSLTELDSILSPRNQGSQKTDTCPDFIAPGE